MVCTSEFTLTFVNDTEFVLDEGNLFGMGSSLLDFCIQFYPMVVCYDV